MLRISDQDCGQECSEPPMAPDCPGHHQWGRHWEGWSLVGRMAAPAGADLGLQQASPSQVPTGSGSGTGVSVGK